MPPLDVTGSNGPETDREVILEMSRITKKFGSTQVLTEVDFALRKGEIHALMGENGAGKSTLMKIAAGLIDDFEGEIAVDGSPVHLNSPRAATRAGIAMIQQELSLVPELAVDENIFLGQEKRRWPLLGGSPPPDRGNASGPRPAGFPGAYRSAGDPAARR